MTHLQSYHHQNRIIGFFLLLLSFSSIVIIVEKTNAYQPKRICYLLVENNDHLIPIEQLKYSLCTHWIFSFAHLDGYNVTVNPLMDDYIRKVMLTTTNRTEQNFLISIGTTDMSFVQNPSDIEK